MAGPLAGCLGTQRQAVTQRCTRPDPSSCDRLIFTRRRRSLSSSPKLGGAAPVLLLAHQPPSRRHPKRTNREFRENLHWAAVAPRKGEVSAVALPAHHPAGRRLFQLSATDLCASSPNSGSEYASPCEAFTIMKTDIPNRTTLTRSCRWPACEIGSSTHFNTDRKSGV